jgi:hypothetical protein
MTNQQLRRACVRVLKNHLTQGEEGRPVALGCKLWRSEMTVDDVAIVWARLGEELRRDGTAKSFSMPGDWGPLRALLTEYRAVMRERLHSDRKAAHGRSCAVRVAERRVCD